MLELTFNEAKIDPKSEKMIFFLSAYNEIRNYMNKKGITFRPKYHKQWFQEATKGYHVLNLLARNLGFNILTFTILDDNIFVNGKYKRHHFRELFSRKKSLYLDDLVLTDAWTHSKM